MNKDLSCFKLWATQCTLLRHFYSYLADGDAVDKLLALTVSPSISTENAKQHNVLNALSVATLFIVLVGAGYSIYPAPGRRYGLYFPSATGTAVTLFVHEKFLPSRLLPSLGSHQQSSQALQNLQRQLGLIAGGEAGKRAATAVGLRCSADTLLRRVINTPGTKQSGAPHVGIDEWAWHRGHRYGTLIVNLDTHRPLVLLPGRDQRTLAT